VNRPEGGLMVEIRLPLGFARLAEPTKGETAHVQAS
jgi:hypothetical protein